MYEMEPYGARTRPKDHEWLLDDQTCIITQGAFDRLMDYSTSVPTGNYLGKVWKRGEPFGAPKRWFLGEYIPLASKPDTHTAIHWREIIIL